MEETQAVRFSDEDVGQDFYETIEAPKFVDLTVSDPYRPDDRYWFCSRVGCDQKHPEEMDSEAIYKNFVMRVMAARSPNVRLHRARRNMKCPLTAPPKSSKSRVSRLALISSISKRIVDARVKSRLPLTKPTATPNVKPEQAHAKAITTPRNRKLNSNTFLSVRNPKRTLTEVPKTTMVAKALVFQSPKKDAKNKTSMEINTGMRTLCTAMKKLELTSAKKDLLGGGKPLPLDVSRKKFRGREVKSRVFDSLGTLSSKRQDAKSARVLKRTSKEKSLKPLHDQVPHESIDEDASDMDIDDKSRHVSKEGCSLSSSDKSNERNLDAELSKTVEPALNVNADTDDLSENSEGDENSISNSEEKNSEESDFKLEDRCGVEDEKNQECNHEERMKAGSTEINISELESDEQESVTTVNKEDEVISDDIENKSAITVNYENENVPPTDNREGNSYNESERVTFCKNENSIKTEKVKRVLKKTLKENPTPAAVGSHGLKSSRPKPTNPKPFRLRTDERVVLREANLEKKLNYPLRDITTSRRFQGDKLHRKSQCTNQKSEKCLNDGECENRAEVDNGQKMFDSKIPDDGKGGKVPASSNSIKGDSGCKLSKMDSQNCIALKHQKRNLITCQLEPGKEKVTKKTEDKLRRTKSERIQQNVRKPQRDVSSRKEIISVVPPHQLSARKESSLNYKDAPKPAKSLARVRRPATISKEPNLHSSHVPKSRSRKLA